jgi:TetR/AcrR family transcriptional regulator, fatty acid metabolism regulator protein
MGKNNFTNRDRQAQETKKRIFKIAYQLMIKKGFDNVTLQEISKKAGVAKGLFYHYFKSKADLIIETYSIIDDEFIKALSDLDADTSPIDKIFFTVFSMARMARVRGMEFVKQIYKGQLDVGTNYFINKDRPFYKTIYDSIVAGQARGTIKKDLQPDEFSDFILSVARGVLYDWCLREGKYDLEAAMEKYFRNIIFPQNKSK